MENRTYCIHSCAHAICAFVKFPALKKVVGKYLVGRNIALLNCKSWIFFGRPFGFGVYYVEAIKHIAYFYAILVVEDFPAVEIFVSIKLSVGHQAHYNAE
ncbi:hypothetical protein IMSAG192_01558 [Muribaculaceae bacterium]|nr:hypothetical protein IMSAG192_01558 [Muribaculaceae bacterium]